jgi:NAD(P)-dependent dehydrogenase (short-subunit alcohol dehydrogenase family)/rhamnose utilization protein RhaD (predicted bifunctional aldolase and dehydrogenase)
MKEELKALAEISRFYGSDPAYVFLGGGNTSVKIGDRLYIKPSGVALATIEPEQFLPLERNVLKQIFNLDAGLDATTREACAKEILQSAVRPLGSGRPSVEAPVHQVMEYQFIVHLHPALVNAMTCAKNGKDACARLFPEAVWLDYCDPGCTLAGKVREALETNRNANGKQPQVIFLQNHGVFVGADSCEEIRSLYSMILERISQACKEAGVTGDIAFAEADAACVQEAAPALRTLLADAEGNRAVVHCVGNAKPFAGPLTPDHIVYAKSFAYCGKAAKADLEAFRSQHGYLPKVLQIDGKALFTAGADLKEALAVETALKNALQIEALTAAFGGARYLTEREYGFIENWEVESYRRSVQKSERGRLSNRVCVVTGGAQGFGLGIAEYLAAQGGIVVIADMNKDGAAVAAEDLCKKFGSGRAFAVAVNIADEPSVESMFAEITACCGGVDLLVANAGVLRAGSVLELSKKDWDFVTDINYTGYFLCCKHAARVMSRQIVDGLGRWSDIVQVNSKSGLEGSNKNGAYAGSKFGTIGLTQSFAKELVAQRIKVNSVCPGNFYDGPLWSHPEKGLFVQYLTTGKVPGAKTVEDVRRFYEDKVPMRRGCLPVDVAKAILYCVEQDYETGQAIPVTGGQVMLH